MMNAKIRIAITLAAFALTCGFLPLEQSTSAQSARGLFGPRANSARSTSSQSANSNCKKLKGIRTETFDPSAGIAFGTITGGGWLNGTTEDVVNFGAGISFTPDPNWLTYLSDTTITTVDGQIKASTIVLGDIVLGDVFSQVARINPATSTGRFAGATGVIFFSGKTIGSFETGPYESVITGEICFAQE